MFACVGVDGADCGCTEVDGVSSGETGGHGRGGLPWRQLFLAGEKERGIRGREVAE